MMKRTGVRLGPDEPTSLPPQSAQLQQAGASNMHTLAQSAQPQLISATTAMLSVGGGGSPLCRNTSRAVTPAVINYLKAGTGVQYAPKHQQPVSTGPSLSVPRHKLSTQPQQATTGTVTGVTLTGAMGRVSPAPGVSGVPGGPGGPAPVGPGGLQASSAPQQFQRLKVEDALSYLDQVKYKFNTQPQVYNDFLDIMKEFKSQTIDTPGVITRVSNLFKGHPELIVGFNTFLPPGYKIEVQSNGQVSVSMPSPTGMGAGGVLLGVPHHQPQQQLVHILPVPQSVSSAAIVHNLTVNATPNNTLHHISQAHQQIEAAIHHQQPGTVQPGAGSGGHVPPASGQPVEFNHAIEYVNKIKSRFSRQPDKYKRFLEILHAYQRGHRDVKEPQAKQQTEREVYAQVAKLFENQDDLLAEFGQFLPDAKAVTKPAHYPPHPRTPPLLPPPQRVEPEPERVLSRASPPALHAHAHAHTNTLAHTQHNHHQAPKHTTSVPGITTAPPAQHHLKRSPSFTSTTQMGVGVGAPPARKCRVSSMSGSCRDVTYTEASKYATMAEYNYFERVRKALRSQHIYDNFLRCLLLFTNEIISSSELLIVTAPFLCRHPELQKWLQDFLHPASPPHTPTNTSVHTGYTNTTYDRGNNSLLSYERMPTVPAENKSVRYEPIGALGAQLRHERVQGDAAMEVDLSTCKRLGTSYCALPQDSSSTKCSGRTALCKEVLNDTWVSFPTWSEDSTFVTSRKTQYEEYIYRCEDERFELDVVIETNAATIRVLEGVQKKLSRMTPDDASRYRLDDCLGGHSPTIHQRALRRIYGDKAVDIIAGLKKNPTVAVPVVLRRLKAKEEEWREAQKGFNKQWREQNEKYYLKSLDHQGINFKQNDLKAMRSKSLFNEIESAYSARKQGPHIIVDYNLKGRQEAIKIVRDVAELLIHHARRQTAIQKAEKRRIKQLLRQFLPDLFAHPRQPLSDDERDEEEKEESPPSPGSPVNDKDTIQGDKNNSSSVKQEKQESSESDNASDKSAKNNKNDKENKPKNHNNMDIKESMNANTNCGANNVKRTGSNDDSSLKQDIKMEPDVDDDLRDHPPNEARFVCTMPWYLFLRLHGVLCARLGAAAAVAREYELEHRRHNSAQRGGAHHAHHTPVATALRLKPNNLPADVTSPAEYYNALLELVKGVLDGNTEPGAYEDAAREMYGIKAYPAYTLDKLVSAAVRQLQHCVSEPWSVRSAELCARGGMRGPLACVHRAQHTLRHELPSFLVKLYGGEDCKVTIELLESPGEGRASPQQNDNSRLSPTAQSRASTTNGESVSRLAAWALYREQYSRVCTTDSAGAGGGGNKPVFLKRNARAAAGAQYTHAHNAASGDAGGGGGSVTPHARRKPPRVIDHTEATLAHTIRLVTSRPHHLYRAGCLSSALASHARLHARRRAKFRDWLCHHAPDK